MNKNVFFLQKLKILAQTWRLNDVSKYYVKTQNPKVTECDAVPNQGLILSKDI